jgi:predicted MFS family arabinose efflux permease
MRPPAELTDNLRGRPAVVLTAVLCLAIFVGATSWFAPLALLPFIADGFGASVSLVGQVVSGSIFLAAIMALVIGTLVRRHGYRRLYVAGTIAMSLGTAAMAVAPNVAVMLVAALLLSFATAIVIPVALALAAKELSPTAGRRAMSYQIACVFAAIAVGLPVCVFLAQVLSWRGAFVALAVVAMFLLPAIFRIVPVGVRDPCAAIDVASTVGQYRELLSERSLLAMYVFQVLYVICGFGSGAYATALIASRGFDAQAQGVALLVAGVAFVLTSVLAAEALGKLRIDLRLVIIVGTLGFCLARGTMYIAPLPLAAIIGLLGIASLCDGAVAVAMRALIASYDVRDRTLSMVFFAACGSFGQAVGGVGAGIAIALGGYAGVGVLVLALCAFAIWLPVVSGRLIRPATVRLEALGSQAS